MKGRHHIIVENKRMRYEFDIRRNITIIRGDSATGKTTLISMLENYQSDGESSGVSVISDCPLHTLNSVEWKYRIEQAKGAIFFIDECNHFTVTQEFAEVVKKADAYFVLIQRENLPNLPYSVEEIYGIRVSNRYGGLKKTYNEFYQLYGDRKKNRPEKTDLVIIEDSNSGYQFYSHKCGTAVVSADGKSNIEKVIRQNSGKQFLIIADGAAFGSEMEGVMRLSDNGEAVVCYLPESFEYLILYADLLKDKEVRTWLEKPEDYIESREFFSWERFFTKVLIEKSKNSYLKYQKSILNSVYLQNRNRDKVIEVLPAEIQGLFK